MRSRSRRRSAPRANARPAAFTLLEVVLAVSIATGLLVVVLYFYQQAARLRDSTLGATARLAAVRLCMDRLGTELRTASARPGSFRGGAQQIEFVRYDFTGAAAGSARTESAVGWDRFPIRRVRYGLRAGADATGGQGVERSEQPLGPASASASVVEPEPAGAGLEPEPETEPASGTATGLEVATGGLTRRPSADPPAPADGAALEPVPSLGGGSFVVVPELRFMRLRYWDGAAWLEAWTGEGLPRAVEISLASESVPAEANPDALPAEVFRRVIALPTAAWPQEGQSASGPGTGTSGPGLDLGEEPP